MVVEDLAGLIPPGADEADRAAWPAGARRSLSAGDEDGDRLGGGQPHVRWKRRAAPGFRAAAANRAVSRSALAGSGARRSLPGGAARRGGLCLAAMGRGDSRRVPTCVRVSRQRERQRGRAGSAGPPAGRIDAARRHVVGADIQRVWRKYPRLFIAPPNPAPCSPSAQQPRVDRRIGKVRHAGLDVRPAGLHDSRPPWSLQLKGGLSTGGGAADIAITLQLRLRNLPTVAGQSAPLAASDDEVCFLAAPTVARAGPARRDRCGSRSEPGCADA